LLLHQHFELRLQQQLLNLRRKLRHLEPIQWISFGRNLQLKLNQHSNMYFLNCPISTLAGFDPTTHSSNLLGGRRRRYL
jgi:hypothetical protein